MNGKTTKLNQQQQQQQEQEQLESLRQESTQSQSAQEFSTVEEMLRFDSAAQVVPGKVVERLQQSIDREQIQAPKPWWKKLFGQ